jgi:hypothetical protein
MNKSCKFFIFLALLLWTFYSNGRKLSAGKVIGLCVLRFTVTQFCKTKFLKAFQFSELLVHKLPACLHISLKFVALKDMHKLGVILHFQLDANQHCMTI